MFKKLLIISFFLTSLSSYATSFSFTASGSGHMNMPVRTYYSYHIYQYAYVDSYNTLSESHAFTFSGALAGEEYAYMIDIADDWIIYEGIKFYIAVPYRAGECIYVKRKNAMRSPRGTSEWIAISDYIF